MAQNDKKTLAFALYISGTIHHISAANKYSPASQHEQKNRKTTGQIKFLAVTIKQQTKLVLQHSLCK